MNFARRSSRATCRITSGRRYFSVFICRSHSIGPLRRWGRSSTIAAMPTAGPRHPMSRHRLTVVLSQAQGKNPAKRALEESIAAALIMETGLDVSILPHLYDLHAEHTGRLFLEGVAGDMVVLSWLFPRAAYWLLDRDGIKGHFGESQLKPPAEDEEEEEEAGEPPPAKGIGAVGVPERHIYCLDLRDFNSHAPYVEEVRRIAAECRERHEARQREKAAA